MGFLSKIFSGGADKLIGTIGGIVDNLTLSKEEKEQLKIDLIKAQNEHEIKLAEIAEKETEAYLADVKNSRDSNVQIQTSDKVPVFIKFVPYVIDCFVFIVWGGLTIWIAGTWLNIIKRDASVNFEGVMGLYAAVTGIAMTVLNFHRGSSKSSDDKQKWMQKMMDK